MTFLFGWGVGEFGNAALVTEVPTLPFSGTGWTSVLVEQGVIGFAAYSYFFWTFLKGIKEGFGASVFLDSRRRLAKIDRGIMMLLVVFLILSGISGGLGFERSLRFWVIATSVNIVRRSVASSI